jgi:NADH:ubiquinone oxidoreductase subunit 6 (subunit J)
MKAKRDKLPLSRFQRILRYAGAVVLSVCGVMVVLGSTILSERLHGPQFLIYWSWCLLLTILAIVIALVDMLLVRRASKRTRQELFQRQFMSQDFANKLRKKTPEK